MIDVKFVVAEMEKVSLVEEIWRRGEEEVMLMDWKRQLSRRRIPSRESMSEVELCIVRDSPPTVVRTRLAMLVCAEEAIRRSGLFRVTVEGESIVEFVRESVASSLR